MLFERVSGYVRGEAPAEVTLTGLNGQTIGVNGRITGDWTKANHTYQIEFLINGKIYTGRCGGVGTLWRGKVKIGLQGHNPHSGA